MKPELHANSIGGRASEFPTSTPKPPRRALIILSAMALLALGLIVAPRPALFFPNVVVEAGDRRLQFNFLLNPTQLESACQSAGATLAKSIAASCPDCLVCEVLCLRNPAKDVARQLGPDPLPMPSTRLTGGVVTYKSDQADVAQSACRESVRQAALRTEGIEVACDPAGSPRPHLLAASSLDKAQTGYDDLNLLLSGIGVLLASIVFATTFAYWRRTRMPVAQLATASYPRLVKHTLAGVDTLILLGTFVTLAWSMSDEMPRSSLIDPNTLISYGIIVVLAVGSFWVFFEHYSRRRPFWDELREVIRVLLIMGAVSGAVAFAGGFEMGRYSLPLAWLLNLTMLPLGRSGTRKLLDELGLWKTPALIVGTGENAREAYLGVCSESNMGYRFLGFVRADSGDTAPKSMEIGGEIVPIIDFADIETLTPNVQIIVALESLTEERSRVLVQQLVSRSNNVHLIPSIRGLPLFGTQLSHFFSREVLLLTLRNNLARRSYKWIKRGFDVVVASLLLIILSPLFLYISSRIRQDGGRAFYGHTRVGQNGKSFKCLKFRSMRSDADKVLQDLLANDPIARAEWDRDFKLKNDPRITSIGHFLRKTSLDELPQLINVVRGEMSLVGPRPVVTAELERYGDYVNLYLQVRPGMTGLWQVSGRNDTSYDQRVSLDAWYVQNWSLWYDIVILFKTVDVVFNSRGAY